MDILLECICPSPSNINIPVLPAGFISYVAFSLGSISFLTSLRLVYFHLKALQERNKCEILAHSSGIGAERHFVIWW